MTRPRFTVILPTCNRLRQLRRALASVEQQSLRDFELILVDDGSVDGTSEYLAGQQLSKDFPNIPSLILLSNKSSMGAGFARNHALARARGELIAFLDDDDVWMPDYLESQLVRLQQHPEAGASCAAHIECDENGGTHVPDLEQLFEYQQQIVCLLTESFVHSMSVLVARRAVFEEIGPLNPELRVCHDWDWCARLLSAGYSILTPAGPAVVKRQVPGGLVLQLRDWFEEEQTILEGTFRRDASVRAHRRHILAYRNLLFARIGFSRNQPGFASRRLGSALLYAPIYSINLARLKWLRSRQARNFHEAN